MGQRSQFEKVIFWKIVPIPLPPPAQPNWEVMDIKQRLHNTLIPIPDLFGVKWEVEILHVNLELMWDHENI